MNSRQRAAHAKLGSVDPAAQEARRASEAQRPVLRAPAGGDPLDLLDASASRAMLRANLGSSGGSSRAGAQADGGFARGGDGKLVFREEGAAAGGPAAKRKRRPGGGFDDRASDDSDFDDLRHIGGLAAGMRSASAKSVRARGSDHILCPRGCSNPYCHPL